MDVSEAALWFNTVPVDGWNGTAWVAEVGFGDFLSYDRFVTDRTFGIKKRIFHAPDDTKIDALTYPVIRTPDDKIWIVISDSADIEGEVAYANSYLLLEATLQAEVIEHVSTELASGAEGPGSDVVLATYHCDLERYSASNSDLFVNVAYGGYEVTLPYGAVVDGTKELKINNVLYEIKEVIPELLTTICRCLRRSQ